MERSPMPTLTHRRRHREAVRQSNREAESGIAHLSAEERTVRDQITHLERFLVKAPERAERAQLAQIERLNTLPAPDEFHRADDSDDAHDFAPARLTRARAAHLRRQRSLNLLIFVTVALVLAAFALWFADHL